MASVLNEDQIRKRLGAVQGWQRKGSEISKVYDLKNFARAMGFVSSVALLAEKVNHHPDIDIRWSKVTLTLSTHSEGGLTDKDFNLAEEIDRL